MAKTKAPVVDTVETEATEVVEETVKAPKTKAPKAVKKFYPKSVSQSTKSVSFEWSKGKKSGTNETMSDNVAEIMEHKGLGKKVK
jgi:BRCT domain type II-containing protein